MQATERGVVFARIGDLRKSLEDYVELGHAGCQLGGGSIPERRLPKVWRASTWRL